MVQRIQTQQTKHSHSMGQTNDIDVINSIIKLKGKSVVDVGCGEGEFARELAEQGAVVIGVEPDAKQARHNREAQPFENVHLHQGEAQSLPLGDASQDALIFRFSLHHIPTHYHGAVFKEAARVLKAQGLLYIIEPVAKGPFHYVMELFHDETQVRAKAQNSVNTCALEYFDLNACYNYEIVRDFANFDDYVSRYGQLSYNQYDYNQVANDEVRARFLQYSDNGIGARLIQPVKADLLIKLT